jgi:hypothetical protein
MITDQDIRAAEERMRLATVDHGVAVCMGQKTPKGTPAARQAFQCFDITESRLMTAIQVLSKMKAARERNAQIAKGDLTDDFLRRMGLK